MRCSPFTTPASFRSFRRQGSVGASGDLAPLAHLTLALIGEGEIVVRRRARAGRAARCATPASRRCVLDAKEGLALINGTQVSTALALHALFTFEPVLEAALVVGALTRRRRARQRRAVRSAHPRAARPAGADRRRAATTARCSPAARSAARTSRATTASRIRTACAASRRSSAPASTSCAMPRWCCVREANAVTDNPLVFAPDDDEDGAIISGGNFHAEPVALAADAMAVAIAEVGAIAERRIAMLIDSRRLAPAAVPLGRARASTAAS